MNQIRYETDAEGIATLTFDSPDGPVNTMSLAWQADFIACVERVIAEKDKLRGVILASAKSSFFAGADLKGVLQLTEKDAPAAFRNIEAIKAAFRKLELSGRPVVAAINGAALGGGWEICLAAHCRICVDDPKIELGCPEASLGLLPGAGGVTKMTRLLGLQAALPLLAEGKLMRPGEAMQLKRARAWIAANPEPKQPWDRKEFKIPGGGARAPGAAMMVVVAPAVLTQKTRGLYPAPEAILSCAVEGTLTDFDSAMRNESRYLAKLMTGQIARNMITAFFFNLNAIKSGASRPKNVPKWKATRVGILGAGMMGAGIAWANATRRIPCVLKDVTPEQAEKGKAYSAKLLEKRVKQGRTDAAGAAQTLDLIKTTASADDLAGCDLIVEAVFENRELKAKVTKEAEPRLAPDGIFASNTSTLPITGLAQASQHPDRFIGLHFFSPVEKMQLVEIIVGKETSDATLARAFDYVQQLGKTPIVVNDSRGFFTSRVFSTWVSEGQAMLLEGIPAPVIENAARQAGMPVGPLAIADEVSMKLAQMARKQAAADPSAEGRIFRQHPAYALVDRMVDEFKRPGRAGGAGFYEYPAGGEEFLWPELKRLFEKPGTAWDMQELKDRILYIQAIESARCLEEGVLRNVADANVGSIFGIGFPAWAGGALQFINSVGVAKFAARADDLAAKYGERYACPKIVRDKALAGEVFV
ncbi:MAG: 3-hydroxyacyl-CoA dehydrogenase NAD-binding domain-containing protein [Proteobacteria bacterium]|nr:3-hydroxyacyl-CoA dehydrogenase NAD-binding domain-containing protein [Pseudomonadota bacterium]